MQTATIPEPVVVDALGELDQYLSDRLAPLMIAESMTVLARVPVDRVARQVHTWAAAQRAASSLPLADYLFHALRKVQIVGEFRLLPPSLFSSFFAGLQNGVLALTPAEQRPLLAADLAKLGQTDTRSVEQVERLHRPAGASEGKAEAPRAEPAEPARGGKLRLWAGLTLPEATLRRLSLLFDTLGQLAPSVPAKRRVALAADAFATASSAASSPAEMDAQLQQFSASGVVAHTYEAFRMLGESLPAWWAPGLPDASQAGPQIQAMRRMITLTSDRRETSRRFREMVENAIEQFNAGAMGRAVRMFDLALGMLQRGEVEPDTVEPLRAKGHQSLDPERLGELLDDRDRRGFPRVVLRFFRAFDPEELLDELAGESRRDKRLRLLALLEAHGDEGRRRAFERLTRTPYVTRDYYLFRNLVHLLRKIPRSVNTTWELEHEIAIYDHGASELARLDDMERQLRHLDAEISDKQITLRTLQKMEDEGSTEEIAAAKRTVKERLDAMRAELRASVAEHTRLEEQPDAAYNPHWGPMFREGHEISKFGEQVEAYACVYTSRVSNFSFYSPNRHFRGPRDRMPHER